MNALAACMMIGVSLVCTMMGAFTLSFLGLALAFGFLALNRV